jgi:pimeloyl-ACP methyl ester carboxylesterase
MATRRGFDPRRAMESAVGLVDRVVVVAMSARARTDRARADAMTHAEQMTRLADAYAAYEGEAHVADPAGLFPAPPQIDPGARDVRPGVWEASWSSGFAPFLADVAERYLSRVENRTARARLYLAEAPGARTTRAAVIAVHGYMGGQWALEENAWPVEWLTRRGLDVALPVLPFHGMRAGSRRGAPGFPSSDPRITNEGFRQAVTEIRALARWLRERGAPHVGVVGMSLGGYTSALVATVTGELDFVMPMIPLASIADLAREHGRLGTAGEADERHAALERANRVVSPLARPLRVATSRALVVGARNDRITPLAHAERLARHFGCAMFTMGGGHLVQLGRSEAFRGLVAMLEREGIVAPRRPPP